MKNKIWLIDLEFVPTRYTCEWKTEFPKELSQIVSNGTNSGTIYEIENISGGEEVIEATPGAFLNFQQTNLYKNNQINQIAARFSEVKDGDVFIFADAWHTGVLQLRYMAELLKKNVKFVGLWHAGKYDQHDILGRSLSESWVGPLEVSLFQAYDHNVFATHFHSEMFRKCRMKLNSSRWSDMAKSKKFITCGWPMEYTHNMLDEYKNIPKEDIVLFPHRITEEKQPHIFKELQRRMPEYKFVICQELGLSKKEYHTYLARSKVIFSAALQETLGITPYEGLCLGTIPMLPRRLSYEEMYSEKFMYPSGWADEIHYPNYDELEKRLRHMMEYYDTYQSIASDNLQVLKNVFFSFKEIKTIL